jgi:8-oxo-dGTP pyrophosphatase MutT (NUDIX family)
MVTNGEGKLLALRRSSTDENRPSTWDLPGGQLDEGESITESARREIHEETGLEVGDITLFTADARFNKEHEYWVVLFSTAATVSTEVRLSKEHTEYAWLTLQDFLLLDSSARIKDVLSKRLTQSLQH